MSTPLRFAVLTVSDRCSAGVREDRGGPAVVDAMHSLPGAQCADTAIVPDDADLIIKQLRSWLTGNHPPDLILTTGGTGLSPRDITPEATQQILERRHDGLLELARLRCYSITPLTYLSRGVAGTVGRCLIINLPGSPAGAVQMLQSLLDVLPHAVHTLRDQATHHPPVAP